MCLVENVPGPNHSLMDNDSVCTPLVPGYLDQWAAGLVHDCPRVGGQRPAEEGGAQVHRHRGEPKHTEREGDDMPCYNRMQCSSVYLKRVMYLILTTCM